MGVFGGTRPDEGGQAEYARLEARVAELEAEVAALREGRDRTGGTAAWGSAPGGHDARLAALEAAVARIEGHGDVPDSISAWNWEGEARRMAAQGQKIAAVKIVRQGTGWGLKQAKDYVDRL